MSKYATHGYDFYFGEFRLPVTPSALTIKTPSTNETVTLINQGEINIVKEQGLREISFSFLLPHQKYAFVKSGKDDPNKITSATSIGLSALGTAVQAGSSAFFSSGSWEQAGIDAADSAFSLVGDTLLAKFADFSPAYFIPLLEDMKKYKRVFQFKVYRNDISDIMNTAKTAVSFGLDWGADYLSSSNYSSIGTKIAGKIGVSSVLMGKTVANQLMNGDKTKLPNTSIKVVIEDIEFEEDAESYGRDIMCNITLKEYKPYSTKQYNIKKDEKGKKTVDATKKRDVSKETPQSVKVKAGDTLWNLCKKNLGDGSKFKEIAKLNGISNPNLIFPNQVIRFK